MDAVRNAQEAVSWRRQAARVLGGDPTPASAPADELRGDLRPRVVLLGVNCAFSLTQDRQANPP